MAGAPVILEVAVNGANPPDRNPHIPLGPREIAADVRACHDAGASILHVHCGEITLGPQEATRAYLEAMAPVLAERPHLLWYPTLCGGRGVPMEVKYAHHGALAAEVPVHFAAVDPGCTNFGSPDEEGLPVGSPYVNSYADIRVAFGVCAGHGLGPSIAIYEPGFLRTTVAYHRAGRLPRGAMVKLYFGGEWGMQAKGRGVTFGLPPTELALRTYVEMIEPTGLPWSVSVWGGDLMQTPVADLALELGGHLHVGLEEHFDPDRKPTNVELLAEAVECCARSGRPVASRVETLAALFGEPREDAPPVAKA